MTLLGYPNVRNYDGSWTECGNLVEEKKGSTTKPYSYDADDRLWDITVGTAGMRYGYDNDGNRKWASDKATAVNTSFSYDYENRMTARGTCTYTYAPNGERMSSACSAPTYYRYDSPVPGGLSNTVAEYDATGARQARYTPGPTVDAPVEQLRAGSYYTYQKDGLGSVSKITDASQATVNAYTYGPWGDTNSSGSLSNPFRYTGREADSSSPLYHYRARVYDPEARRFVQKDPAGTCAGPNLYAYAGNNPVNRVDPSGQDWKDTRVPCTIYRCVGWWCIPMWIGTWKFSFDLFRGCLAVMPFASIFWIGWCAYGLNYYCWGVCAAAIAIGGWYLCALCLAAWCGPITYATGYCANQATKCF